MRRADLRERAVLLRLVGVTTNPIDYRKWHAWCVLRQQNHPRTLADEMRCFPTDALIESAAYAWGTGPRTSKRGATKR